MKRKAFTLLAIVLASGLIGSSIPCCAAEAGSENETTAVSAESAGNTDGLVVLLEKKGDFSLDGNNDGIYIAELTDQYFEGGVEAGMAELLDAGQVYINGIQLPVEEEVFYLNGSKGIWQKEDGSWTWQVHDFVNRDNEDTVDHNGDYSYEFARRYFVLAATAVRGSHTTIYAEEGSDVACRVDIFVVSGATIEDVVVNDDGTTTVWGTPVDSDAYNLDGGPNDIEERIFPTENVDPELQSGDIAIYWYGSKGWEIQRAFTIVGSEVELDGRNVIMDGVTYYEALCIRTNMQEGDRPTQFFSSYFTLGLTDIPVTLWMTEEDGYTVGASYGEYSREALEKAIACVDERLEGLTILPSEDGTDIPSEYYWVDGATWAAFYTAYAEATAVLEDESSSAFEMDAAIQVLCEAFIGDAFGDTVEDLYACDTGILGYQAGTKE